MRVLALDPATTSGWCFGGSKMGFADWNAGHFRAPKRPETGERLILIYDQVLELIDRFEPDMLAHEGVFDPSYQDAKAGKERIQFKRSTMQFLQMVKGAVIMAAARRSVPTEEYQPRSWRATLKLPQRPEGADDKWIKRVTFDAITRMGIPVQTTDEADAAGICFHALHGKPGIERATADLFERARASL